MATITPRHAPGSVFRLLPASCRQHPGEGVHRVYTVQNPSRRERESRKRADAVVLPFYTCAAAWGARLLSTSLFAAHYIHSRRSQYDELCGLHGARPYSLATCSSDPPDYHKRWPVQYIISAECRALPIDIASASVAVSPLQSAAILSVADCVLVALRPALCEAT